MAKWIRFKVRPINNAPVKPLDEYLNEFMSAAVTQHLEAGEFSYKPDEDGTYEVRLFAPHRKEELKGYLRHFSFELVSEEEMD
jgi:hypothetical protein